MGEIRDIPALRGNQSWKLRAKDGPDRIFGDAALLLGHAVAYFKWCDAHPRYKAELVKYKGGYDIAEVPLGRPYTLDGLTVYLGVSRSYFDTAQRDLSEKINEGRATQRETELHAAIDAIKATIRNEQVEGALVGQYKEGLVARLNGISDNINTTNAGESVVRVVVRDTETAANMEKLNDLL